LSTHNTPAGAGPEPELIAESVRHDPICEGWMRTAGRPCSCAVRPAESVAALALAAWRAPIDDIPPESPADVDWDCYRDCWTDGFETGYKAAQAALIDGDDRG
jgi:hypothetical protein